MSEAQVINEYELLEFTRCPLRVSTGKPYAPSDWQTAVDSVAEQVILAAYEDRMMSRREVDRLLCDTMRPIISAPWHDKRWVRVSEIQARLDEIVIANRVLQPIRDRTLTIGSATVTMRYAVVQRRYEKREVSILRLRGLASEWQPFARAKKYPPDILDFARVVHLASLGLGRRYSSLNWHVARQISWRHQIAIDAAGAAVKAALRCWQEDLRYPAPGHHCINCQTQKCSLLKPPRRKRAKTKYRPSPHVLELLQNITTGGNPAPDFSRASAGIGDSSRSKLKFG